MTVRRETGPQNSALTYRTISASLA